MLFLKEAMLLLLRSLVRYNRIFKRVFRQPSCQYIEYQESESKFSTNYFYLIKNNSEF